MNTTGEGAKLNGQLYFIDRSIGCAGFASALDYMVEQLCVRYLL